MSKCGNCNFCSRGRRRSSSTSTPEFGAIGLGLINFLSLWMASSRMTFVLVFAAGVIVSTVIQFLPEILHITPTTDPGIINFSSGVVFEEQPIKRSALPWQEHVQPIDESKIYKSHIILHRHVQDETVDDRNLETEALSALKIALEMKENGKEDKALKLFQHAYALNPTHPDILNHYGEFLEEHTKDILLAEHLYTRALVLCPVHSRALENRQRTLPLVVELDDGRLRRVDLKRAQLMRIPESSAALRRVKKEAYFQHIHHTVAIEGNTMTLAETRSIVETKLAVGGKSILEHNEILGLEVALSYINNTLVNKMGYLTVQDVLDIHRRVLGSADPMEAGTFRVTQVFIGDHIPPRPSEVHDLMQEFIQWLNSVEALGLHPIKHAALAHYKLVYIHPFTNGNGRTARLLMNLILMRAGYPPVIIRMQDRQRYYDCLKLANEGDVRPFVRFIAECTETTLDVYLFATTEYSGRDVPALETRDRRTIIV